MSLRTSTGTPSLPSSVLLDTLESRAKGVRLVEAGVDSALLLPSGVSLPTRRPAAPDVGRAAAEVRTRAQ